GEKLWLLRHQSGLKGPKEATAPGLALARAALENPAAAVRLASSASEADIAALGHATWALLYCEAARLGNAELEKSLARSGGRTRLGRVGRAGKAPQARPARARRLTRDRPRSRAPGCGLVGAIEKPVAHRAGAQDAARRGASPRRVARADHQRHPGLEDLRR